MNRPISSDSIITPGTRAWLAITRAWLALGQLLNRISTTILLTGVFLVVVLPIGLIRRITGADPLRLKQFKKDRQSVLFTRNHTYSQNDLKNLF